MSSANLLTPNEVAVVFYEAVSFLFVFVNLNLLTTLLVGV